MKHITLQELCSYCDQLLTPADFTDYCPNGLQVEGASQIFKIATAVSASVQTIKEAIKIGVNALIVHHGIFWKGDSYPIIGIKREKLELLMQHKISLLAYHLPLDAHNFLGNNWKAALDLNWQNLSPFGAMHGKHIGVKGTFFPISRQSFTDLLENYYKHSANVVFGGKEVVSSAALISGGAYKNIGEASRAGVDCYVTGNYDEPVWHDAHELGINFLAMGHSATERVGPIALGKQLAENFGISSSFIEVYNPF